jgi:hypothetical protein
MGRIVQGIHRTRDASYEGHIVLGTNRNWDTLYTELIVQGGASHKGCVVQGTYHLGTQNQVTSTRQPDKSK